MDNSSFLNFLNEASHKIVTKVQEDLGFGYVRLNIDEASLRQAKQDIGCVEDLIIELLRNSRDANAKNIFVSSSKGNSTFDLTVIDDGCGIPEQMRDLIFEPRVTAKLDTWHKDEWGVHGRGMALYSIAQNSKEAFVKYSELKTGTSIVIKVNTQELNMLDDQSTYPVLNIDTNGNYIVKSGPHNIIRTICEFAISEQNSINVFFGSNISIITTIRQLNMQRAIYARDYDSIFTQLATCDSPSDLVEISEKLGLKLSYRSAQRILNGEIDPCLPVLELALKNNKIKYGNKLKSQDIDLVEQDFDKLDNKTNHKKLILSKKDKEKIALDFAKSVNKILEENYIESSGQARVKIGKKSISVKIDFE